MHGDKAIQSPSKKFYYVGCVGDRIMQPKKCLFEVLCRFSGFISYSPGHQY